MEVKSNHTINFLGTLEGMRYKGGSPHRENENATEEVLANLKTPQSPNDGIAKHDFLQKDFNSKTKSEKQTESENYV